MSDFSTKFVDKSVTYSHLHEIKREIRQKIGETKEFVVTEKSDKSKVTELDNFICDLFKKRFLNNFRDLSYFSEEDQERFQFPMIILDPIDGTRELIEKIGECAVSFGVYYSPNLSDPNNFSWIYNPFTGMEISSDTNFYSSKVDNLKNLKQVLVSRTEFEKNSFKKAPDNYQIRPIGSIANKLMLLSYGIGDAVVSKRPKNIWDIMAGTHIAFKRGYSLYNKGKKVGALDKVLYGPDFIWTKQSPDDFQF